MYLLRYHDVTFSASGVWWLLHKAGISRLLASRRYKRTDTTRWKRYAKRRPGQQLRMDVKFIEPLIGPDRPKSNTRTSPSTTAPACGPYLPIRATTRRPSSSSSTTFWPSRPSPWIVSRPPMVRSSARRCTGTSSTRPPAMGTPNPAHPCSTGGWDVLTESTPRGSINCSWAGSLTTHNCSPRSSRSGRATALTTEGPTEPSADGHPSNAADRGSKAHGHQPPSVAR